MEQKDVQVEEGIRLSDIFKLLLSKIKLLILVLVAGAIVGGSFAVWKTHDVKYYGTSLAFYVNPDKSDDSATGGESQYGVYGAYGRHVMDNMIKLLSEGIFTEQMLLNGQTLPDITEQWTTPEEEQSLDLKGKIQAVNNAEIEKKKEAVEAAYGVTKDKYATLSDMTTALNTEWAKLYNSGKVTSKNFNEDEYLGELGEAKIQGQDFAELLDKAYNNHEAAQITYDGAVDSYRDAKAALAEANKTIEEVFTAWRKTAKYKQKLKAYQAALSFSYIRANEDLEDADNLAKSFIYVDISVLNDEDLAEELLAKIETVVPQYVKEKMTVPAGYDGTNCEITTRLYSIQRTNPGYTSKQAVLYSILAGGAALLVTCIILILLDKSDKRLRDPDLITREFNVPLLGIIPSIDELNEITSNKKTEVK